MPPLFYLCQNFYPNINSIIIMKKIPQRPQKLSPKFVFLDAVPIPHPVSYLLHLFLQFYYNFRYTTSLHSNERKRTVDNSLLYH